MRLEDLDYDLPPDRVAQEPSPERDSSRLMAVRRGGPVTGHHAFRDLPRLLAPGDLLVLNDTRVVPARLVGRRARTEGKWEGLYLRALSGGEWEMLCQTRGRLIVGETLLVDPPAGGPAPLRLCLVGKTAAGHWRARPEAEGDAPGLLAHFGRVPLPPYIRKGRARADDRERYQTVYAGPPGAVAAPTAGLHFTPAVFDALRERGIPRAFVTLHVGAGTFQPVQAADPRDHRVGAEWGEVPEAAAAAVAACRARGGRVIAVGTTTARVLETAAAAAGDGAPLPAWRGETALTVCPPYQFRAADALVTNFHLPRSSLLMLVAAFTGLESMRAAYAEAVAAGYRFYSYGDAMLIA